MIKNEGRRSLAVPADVSLVAGVEDDDSASRARSGKPFDIGKLSSQWYHSRSGAYALCVNSQPGSFTNRFLYSKLQRLRDFADTSLIRVTQVTVESFDHVMAVNARGTILCHDICFTACLLPTKKQMIAWGRGGQGGGRIGLLYQCSPSQLLSLSFLNTPGESSPAGSSLSHCVVPSPP